VSRDPSKPYPQDFPPPETGHFGLGRDQIFSERRVVPNETRCTGVFHGLRVVETGDRTGYAADQIAKVRADLVGDAVRRVTRRAFLENRSTRFGVLCEGSRRRQGQTGERDKRYGK
jgi:hypothetical protein